MRTLGAAMLLPMAVASAHGDVVKPEALHDYARARLADSQGAEDIALASYARAFDVDAAALPITSRAYRQAVESGDRALAVRTAVQLDARGALPIEGRLLLLGDALATKRWAIARAHVATLEKEGNFAFLAPIAISWITLGEGNFTPPHLDEQGRFVALTRRYVAENAALEQLALKQADAALTELDKALTLRSTPTTGLRITAALRLAELGRRAEALKLLEGEERPLAIVRDRISTGKKVKAPAITPATGFARQLYRLAEDLGGGDSQAMSLSLARMASFLDAGEDEYRVGIARRLTASKRGEEARRELDQVADNSPYAAPARDARIESLLADGDNDAALVLAQGEEATTSADQARLGAIYSRTGHHAEAAQAYERAIAMEGADAQWSLYLVTGSALERAGRWEEGRARLASAAELAPNEAAALNYLGYAQVERRENVAAALSLLKRASVLKPDDPAIADSLGWARFISGDVAGALPSLEQAVRGAPEDATINEHLGDAYWAAGRRFEARYAWSAARIFAEKASVDRISSKIATGFTPELAAP